MEDEIKIEGNCEENKDEEYQDPFKDLPPIFTNPKDANKKLRIKNLKDRPPPLLTDSDYTNTDSDNDQKTEVDITELTEKELIKFTNEDNDKVTWTFTETKEALNTELKSQQNGNKTEFQEKFLFLCEANPNHYPIDNSDEESEDPKCPNDIGIINKLKINE